MDPCGIGDNGEAFPGLEAFNPQLDVVEPCPGRLYVPIRTLHQQHTRRDCAGDESLDGRDQRVVVVRAWVLPCAVKPTVVSGRSAIGVNIERFLPWSNVGSDASALPP